MSLACDKTTLNTQLLRAPVAKETNYESEFARRSQ